MRGRHLIGLGLALAIAALSCVVHAVETDTEPAKPRSCYSSSPSAPAWTAVCIRQEQFFRDTCGAIQLFAWREQLPAGYFARLIWQESRFDPFALSIAGAQGIAQFIPSTARLRGLRNAFDPSEALAKSAEYLRFLTDKFGNLGLAAVALALEIQREMLVQTAPVVVQVPDDARFLGVAVDLVELRRGAGDGQAAVTQLGIGAGPADLRTRAVRLAGELELHAAVL